jgi:hypothetical protein
MSDRRFFLVWMATFLGFPIGGELAVLLVGSIEGVVTGAVAGVVAGSAIGTAQWLVLRGRPGVGAAWIPATAIGLGVGDAVGAALTGAGTGIGSLIVTGLASGVAVGMLQWTLLRGLFRRAGLWAPVVAISWPLGWTVTWAFGIDVGRAYAVFGSTGALVFAAITGATMLLLLRDRTHG